MQHGQEMLQNYVIAGAQNTVWDPPYRETYDPSLVGSSLPNALNLNTNYTMQATQRPSSQPLTPHYRSKPIQRSGTASPAIKSEPVSMSHTSAPVYGFKTASSHGQCIQQAGSLQPHGGQIMRIPTQADNRQLAGQNHTQDTRTEGNVYEHLCSQSQHAYDATSELSVPIPVYKSRAGLRDQPFQSSGSGSPQHLNNTSHLQRHYDKPRHKARAQRHVSIAPQYTEFFDNFCPHPTKMSLSYETREHPAYPQSTLMEEMQHHRYPSPPPPLTDPPIYTGHQMLEAAAAIFGKMNSTFEEKDAIGARSKALQKPTRTVSKDEEGRYLCNWPGCIEETRAFSRKCEWSKHMDKHDRPYKCPADGCEKLPGFTYSGGLLRHQREVHMLYGGPRKQLNCPHQTCKRYTGKGFSRQENLNEHLRRVHTDGIELPPPAEETENEAERPGLKRKRAGGMDDEHIELRMELARLRRENEEMKKTTENLMQQLVALQSIVGSSVIQQTRLDLATQQPPTLTNLM